MPSRRLPKVLKLSLWETEIIANIISGLSKTQRSRLVFKNPSVTFQDLDQLCDYDQNVSFNDNVRMRDVHTSDRTKSTPNCNVSSGAHVISSVGNRGSNLANIKRCFSCHRAGHMMECRRRLSDSRRKERNHRSTRPEA
jgi:hypothetical protein